jgi:hypothetical protein
MGAIGFIVSLGTGKLLEFMNGKHLLIIGLVLAVVAPISSALTSNPESGLYVSSFPFASNYTNARSWLNVLPTSLISISSVSFIFVTTSTVVLTSVPVEVKSLAGGMVSFSFLALPLLYTNIINQLNTAFQIGSGVALAISAAVTDAVDIQQGHGLAEQYATGLWCSVGLAGLGLIIGIVSVRHKGIGPKDRLGAGPVAI